MPRIIDLRFVIFVLVFGLLAVFLVHNLDSIGQDIGRHLKTGEIIWQTGSVPTTNLFSFTEPDFPFINHHWLSEVIFYGVHSWAGFTGLILLKIFVVLGAFLLLFIFLTRFDLKVEQGRTLSVAFWPLVASFLLSIFVFISRTEVRPEIFSFLILAFFLFVLFRAKYSPRINDSASPKGLRSRSDVQRTSDVKYLWFLPLAQLLWVNLHIYFFIGPLLLGAFLIDWLVNLRSDLFKDLRSDLKMVTLIFVLTSAATLVNPAGIQGALLPFNILKEYGYSIVENQTLAFLADFFGFNLPIFVFKVSVAALVVSFLLTLKNIKNRIFEILISAFFIYAGFKMLRNLPLYALASFPVMAVALTDVVAIFRAKLIGKTCKTRSCLLIVAVFLVFMIFFVASGGYYKWAGLSKSFGFSVPDGLKQATDFVKENNIEGPMFNNFDIGGYLIWQIKGSGTFLSDKKVPDPFRVFIDNRPEAYSVEFFSEIYKPMQEEREKWKEFSEKYGINFIFFGHTDRTPWGQTFLQNIIRDPNWKVVFINENAIILVKKIAKNEPIFSKYKYELTE